MIIAIGSLLANESSNESALDDDDRQGALWLVDPSVGGRIQKKKKRKERKKNHLRWRDDRCRLLALRRPAPLASRRGRDVDDDDDDGGGGGGGVGGVAGVAGRGVRRERTFKALPRSERT